MQRKANPRIRNLPVPVLPSWVKWSSFFPRHRNALARQPNCISTASSRLAPNFFFFPLYTTKAELMIAFTTGTALVLTRAMLRCSGHTSPLIWEQCENIWSVLMLPVLVEYLLRNWVAFITFKTTPNFTRWASMTFSFVKAYGCINWRRLSENCCVPCCPFALTLMWNWRMYLRTLGNISF